MNILRCKACSDGCHLFFTVEDPPGTGQEYTLTIEHDLFCAESFMPFANYLFWSRFMVGPETQPVAERSP